MNIPTNRKSAVLVRNVGLYIEARRPLDLASGHFKGGEYRILYNGEYITVKQYEGKVKEVEKILRPVNYKGMNKDNRSHMNLGFRNN